jgi:Uma2 family endonuclease
MSQIIDNILEMPNAFSIHSELTQKLNVEKEKRQKFYEEIDETIKAEFINGEIILHSPVMRRHNTALQNLILILSPYVKNNNLGEIGIEKIMISLTRNDYEPDICFFRKEISDKFTDEQTHFPTPNFIVEILSKSTEKNDRNIKFVDYQQHGVEEYWIVDPEKQFIEQYILKNGEFVKIENTAFIKCHVLDGLEVNIPSVF